MDGAKQSDWWKLTKFVEFAYRRMYIPGTNLTPFMVARGRQPTVPSELERLQTGGALPSMSSLDAHTQELQKHLQLATQLLTAAREKQLAVSREKFNQSQVLRKAIPEPVCLSLTDRRGPGRCASPKRAPGWRSPASRVASRRSGGSGFPAR